MKKLLLLLLWVSAGVQAQIVSIPDPVFKAKLLQLGFDTSGDGEISQTEADAIAYLNLNNTAITNLEGIQSFHNLNTLSINYTAITSLNLSGFQYLTEVYASNIPTLSSASLSSLPVFHYIELSHTALTSLQFVATPFLSNVEARYVTSSGFSLDMTTAGVSAPSLTSLYLNDSTITSLNITGTRVRMVEAYDSSLEVIMASDTPYLYKVECDNSAMISAHFENSGITSLVASNNASFQDLSITGDSALTSLEAFHCGLTSIDFTGCTALHSAYLSYNSLSTLDLSMCPHLSSIMAYGNPLQYLSLKNGAAENYLGSLPAFMCVDEFELYIYNDIWINTTTVVSPYCTLTPGGNYNELSGTVTFDIDNNGCDAQDPGQAFTALSFTSGNNQYTTFSLDDGNYLSYIPGTGTYFIQPALENPTLFTVTPPVSQLTLSGTTTSADLDFCITPNGIHHDVEVVIAPLGVIRPGFDASYAVTYRNKGNQVENGQVSFQFDDDKLDFLSASITPNATGAGNLGWNFTGLLPYESRTINVTLNANSPIETPPVNIGDIMVYNSTITLLQPDENPNDNAFSFNHTVVGAYDPNDITCLEGNIVNTSLIGQYLHYNVNFENTGNYPAENVVVRMKMDASKFDMNTLQFIESSHQPRVQRSGDLVEFIFEDIQIQPEGKGNVLFKIKTKNTLVTGNSVSQKADIYFDFNAPVATNTATTTFQQLGTQTLEEESFVLWPNPASNLVTISGATEIETISIFNLLGQEVARQKGNGRGAQVDVSSLPAGNYLVRVKAVGGEQLMKLVKK